MSLRGHVAKRCAARVTNAISVSMRWLVPSVGRASILGTVARSGLAGPLLIVRVPLALLDSALDAAGFILGYPLFKLTPTLQAAVVGLMLVGAVFFLANWPAWMLVGALALLMIEVLSANSPSLTRIPRAMLAPAKVVASVGLPTAAWHLVPTYQWLVAPVAFMLVRRVFASLQEGMTARAAERAQVIRDCHAAEVVERLRQAESTVATERLIIYLRPFDITGVFEPDIAHVLHVSKENEEQDLLNERGQLIGRTRRIGGVLIGVRERYSLLEACAEFEMLVESALRPAGTFLALGRPGEALGAGRIATNDDWRSLVEWLVERATLCVLVPAANEGTAWEIRHIVRRGLLSKCCVLMPPAMGSFDYAAPWSRAQKALADVITLPPYDLGGGVFRFETLAPALAISATPHATDHAVTSAQAIASAVQSLFPELPKWTVESQEGWLRPAPPTVMSEPIREIRLPGRRPPDE